MGSFGYELDIDQLPINEMIEIFLPANPSSEICQFINEFSDEDSICVEAAQSFDPTFNQLDTTLDTSAKVVVERNDQCYFPNKIIQLEPTFIYSPTNAQSLQSSENLLEENNYVEVLNILTPPQSPIHEFSTKEIIEKTKNHVEKIYEKRKGVKRGRPAKINNSDIDEELKTLPSCETKKARVMKNNKASRDYRRKLAKIREAIDEKLAAEYERFEQLKKENQALEQEIKYLEQQLISQ